jgi:hypothetical protein
MKAPRGDDCNDGDPVLYLDLDHDGVGAPPRQVRCIGATVPDGMARGGFDDDDRDPDVIEVDELDLLLLSDRARRRSRSCHSVRSVAHRGVKITIKLPDCTGSLRLADL